MPDSVWNRALRLGIIRTMLDDDTIRLCNVNGYLFPREVPGRGVCVVCPLLFTSAILVGIDAIGVGRRYCYQTTEEAAVALAAWDGLGDPPGRWIKEKPGDRRGPGAIAPAAAG